VCGNVKWCFSRRGRIVQHYYEDVTGLGNVAVSRHAQEQCAKDNISEADFQRVLLEPIRPDRSDSKGIVWRERDGIRLVVLMNPTPFRGARLIKTAYRVQSQLKATRR
jgi:hypothetical protein